MKRLLPLPAPVPAVPGGAAVVDFPAAASREEASEAAAAPRSETATPVFESRNVGVRVLN